ncbi:RHS repeat-associated core domain-containing protein [Brevundimonas naejangsanensis]|uniref:RHS repeat-associated core domain-containing protein n=1 Tax=Brevundimonas naejangsanensis TaxID=588932 RepID=UPI0026EFE733|nr:RHS repeat-associated core domain-containing protein [Brevundimonas naejangsanensis]
MKTTLKFALLASSALLSTPAWAQQQPMPPEHYTLDSRGVDLVSGRFTYVAPEVSIGPAGTGGLSYGRLYLGPVAGGWRNTLLGTLNVSGSNYAVSIGAETEVFTKSGSAFVPASNRGATLTQSGSTFTFTTSSGSVAKLSAFPSATTTPYVANTAMLMSVSTPEGMVTTYHYSDDWYCANPGPEPGGECQSALTRVQKLQSITNNLGYMLHFQYAAHDPNFDLEGWMQLVKVTGINLAFDYCAPFDPACTDLTRTWPQATYGASGGSSTVTDQSGRVTAYTTTASGFFIRLPGSTTNDIAVTYAAGKVSAVADASGTWAYAYSTPALNTQRVVASGPLGQQITADSDQAIGRATSVKDALNRTTSYGYDSQKRLKRVTQPEADYAELTYDARGNVTQTLYAAKPGSGLTNITTSAVYPATCANPVTCNQPTSTTDARGHATDYTYDATHGGVLTITAPAPTSGAARPQTRIAYAAQTAWYKNAAGVIAAAPSSVTLPVSVSECVTASTCAGTANEVKTSVVYGASGVANNLLPTATTTGAGDGSLSATTAMTYTPDGDVATVDGPLAGTADTTTYRYDDARQLTGVVSPDPDGGGPLLRRAVRYAYNPRGQSTLVEVGTVNGLSESDWAAFASLQRAAQAYDGYGRMTHQRQQSGSTTHSLLQISYDAAGRVDCVTTRMNPSTFSSPPALACTAATAGSFGPDRIMKYGYDAASQLASTISGLGVDPITESATYTANGLPLTLTDGKSNVSTLTYDGFDRLARMNYPNATGGGTSTTDYEEYGYDAASNIVTMRTRAIQTFSATYDALNRQTALNAPAGTPSVTYAYDNLGRLTSASIPGQTTTQAWDALGRLTSETGPLGSMSYQYDLAGRRTRQTWPDAFFVTNSWNLTGEMTAILQGGATQIIGFGYDNLGRRTGITRGNGVTSAYGYDGMGRLTSLSHDVGGTAADVTFGYGYNPAGQIVTKTTSNAAYVYSPTAGSTAYANNGLNQVTSVGGASVGYDANGNITHDATRAFTYDAANRLTGANGGTSTLSYDALGRLYDYVGTNGGRFLYDGAETVGFAPVGSTALQNRFVRGPGVDEIVANFTTTGSTPAQYWAADERGSLVNLSEGTTGSSTVINTYDEYGVPAPSNLGRLQYTGQLWMPDFGAYHYKARAYQPGLGRFLQTDPMGYAEGANLYAYVGADPVNWVDPWGLARFGGICVLPAMKPGTDRVIGDLNVGCISFTIGGGDPYSRNSLDWRFGSGGPRGGGLGSHFPGAGFSGPPIQSDPTYPSYTSSRQQAMDANAWMGVVALAPAAVVLGLETGAVVAGSEAWNATVATRQSIVAFEGPAKGYMRYGVGRVGQVRFGSNRLIIRIDANKPITHLNVQGKIGSKTFNYHFPGW